MFRFMLDTNSVSYTLKGSPPSVRERLRQVPMAQVCVSSITEAELLFGLHHARSGCAVRMCAGRVCAS